ncbi:hypothetical protein [Gordonia sihwensis]|uniref:hypothetical protein n=1 Tax=Gordonia sihwensis TaxID=173559 RepID=UPI0005EF477A|nr:hypothetical protein [Gordonia sihwensis]KJR10462.1 hypothetical protein UG54_00215 [Gordonia sihwensis]
MINPDWVYVIVGIIAVPFVYYMVVHFENDLAWERSLRDQADAEQGVQEREPRHLEPVACRPRPARTSRDPRPVRSAHPAASRPELHRSERHQSAA